MAKKKDFIAAREERDNNPTLSFISKESIAAVDGVENQLSFDAVKPPEGFKRNPEYIEVRSKRVQLVLQPSLYKKVKAASHAAGTSLNDYIHRILEEATK